MKYRTIVADPPWHYDGFAQQATAPHRQDRERGASPAPIVTIPMPYPTMALGEIKALPVDELAHKDSRLFLWATNRYLPDALVIAEGWGFRYRQLIVWDKTPNFNPVSGSVAPNAAEFLIVAARGVPGRKGRWRTSVVQARKPRAVHSQKPDVFLDLVEAVSRGPYLELFARSQRLGWDTWGDEALCHVDLGEGAA